MRCSEQVGVGCLSVSRVGCLSVSKVGVEPEEISPMFTAGWERHEAGGWQHLVCSSAKTPFALALLAPGQPKLLLPNLQNPFLPFFFPPASFPIEKTQGRAVVRGRGSIPLTQCLLPRCFAFCIRSPHQKKKPFCFPNEDNFDNLLAPFPLFPFPFLFYFKFR